MVHVTRGLKRTLTVLAVLAGSAAAQSTLTGGGSTFVNPMMSKWTSEYSKEHSGVQINYQSIGSGGGIRQVSEGTVDFGATDGPMSDEQLKGSKVGPIRHVPVVMGGVVPAYNVPGIKEELKFTPDALAGIFLGKITSWNDPILVKANPGIKLPNQTINVVHRSDGSGTTYIWTDYLSKISAEWRGGPGKGTSVKWPVGIGGKGNEGVAGTVRAIDGAIGYVELIYAVQNNIPYGSVQNSSGNFVKASVESVTAAAASAQVPPDFRYSITNGSGKDAYPISGTTWLLIPEKPKDASKGKVLVDFVNWILGPGQDMCASLTYAKLPENLDARVRDSMKKIQVALQPWAQPQKITLASRK